MKIACNYILLTILFSELLRRYHKILQMSFYFHIIKKSLDVTK